MGLSFLFESNLLLRHRNDGDPLSEDDDHAEQRHDNGHHDQYRRIVPGAGSVNCIYRAVHRVPLGLEKARKTTCQARYN